MGPGRRRRRKLSTGPGRQLRRRGLRRRRGSGRTARHPARWRRGRLFLLPSRIGCGGATDAPTGPQLRSRDRLRAPRRRRERGNASILCARRGEAHAWRRERARHTEVARRCLHRLARRGPVLWEEDLLRPRSRGPRARRLNLHVAEAPSFASIMPVTPQRRRYGAGNVILHCSVEGRHDAPARL